MLKLIGSILKRIPRKKSEPGSSIEQRNTNSVFDEIYRTNYWRGVSRSGEGSDLEQTRVIRKELPKLTAELNVKTMLDLPCGDFFWMRHTDLEVNYIGADIVGELIDENNKKFSSSKRSFVRLDVCKDELPNVDLIFSRDLLVHLSYNDIFAALANMKKSGSRWLLTTTFTRRENNVNIKTGDWRTLNLELQPFNFQSPRYLINEECTQYNGDYDDKCLGLWDLSSLSVK